VGAVFGGGVTAEFAHHIGRLDIVTAAYFLHGGEQ
jgi:hypothetical protein